MADKTAAEIIKLPTTTTDITEHVESIDTDTRVNYHSGTERDLKDFYNDQTKTLYSFGCLLSVWVLPLT